MIVKAASRSAQAHDKPRRDILGTPIDALTMDDVLEMADGAIARRDRLLVGVVNAAKLVNMRRDSALRAAVLDADVILADGMSVVWASRVLGCGLPERVAGIDLMHGLLRRGTSHGYRVYLLGATEAVVRTSASIIEKLYPGVNIAGFRNGYYDEQDEESVVEEIRQSGADLLFVAMSPPKKELFLARWMDDLNVPVCHGVGGALDVLAGKTLRAPERWQRWGLEWLYRIKQEPRRMWKRYLITNTLFVWMVLGALLRRVGTIFQSWRSQL